LSLYGALEKARKEYEEQERLLGQSSRKERESSRSYKRKEKTFRELMAERMAAGKQGGGGGNNK